MLGNFQFHNPTRLHFGENALDFLADELKNYGPTVQLSYGGGSIKKNGIYDQVMAILKKAGKTVVDDGGSLEVYSGGRIGGKIDIAAGATVTVNSGGIVAFDVSHVAPAGESWVNDLSLIQGEPTYTVKLFAKQTAGLYTLADGATDFADGVTINSTRRQELGTTTFGGDPLVWRDHSFTLTEDNGTLSLLVEGGSTVHFSFLQAGLADKVCTFIAPMLVGGKNATPAVGGEGFLRLADGARLTDIKTEMIGKDFCISGYMVKE